MRPGSSTSGLSVNNLIDSNLIYQTGDGFECTRGTANTHLPQQRDVRAPGQARRAVLSRHRMRRNGSRSVSTSSTRRSRAIRMDCS